MDIIKVTDERYQRYEKLLLERDNYRRLAEQHLAAYIREFGQLMTEAFEKKISCIEKKKTITFCQMYANRGELVDLDALQSYITTEMAEYNKQLQQMIDDNNAAQSAGTLTESEVQKVKQIYRKIAKQIHPDIFPETSENPKLQDIWQRVSSAYNCNNLQELEELEVLLNSVMNELGNGISEIDIPNIDEKIINLEKEIHEIISTDPYRFKDLLDDKELVAAKKADLQREIDEYTAYEKELQEILKTFLKNGATFQWET